MEQIETKRTVMKRFSLSDAVNIFELNNDPEVVRYTGDKAFSDIAEARDFLAHYNPYDLYGYGRMSVFLKDTGTYLGWCGLRFQPDQGFTDIGFRFKQAYWNRGFATETALATLQWGFETARLPFIVGRAQTANLASIQVLKKCGMHFWKNGTCSAEPAIYLKLDAPAPPAFQKQEVIACNLAKWRKMTTFEMLNWNTCNL